MNPLKLILPLRNTLRFISSYVHPEKPLGTNEEEIIAKIHHIRLNPSNPYLITGSHFSDLFVRNIGIFYNTLLEPRISSSEEDWHNRQQICYNTVKYALETFAQHGTDATTIATIGRHRTLLNIYSRASDSLYAILYGLNMLTDINTTIDRYPTNLSSRAQRGDLGQPPSSSNLPANNLNHSTLANELLSTHCPSLSHLITKYLSEILDPHTKLVRQDIHLSSARDGLKRQSSFYDNVIAWATTKLAQELNITINLNTKHYPLDTLHSWRTQIIQKYWNPQTGIFNDDIQTTSFSADQLVVLTTQFLDINHPDDRHKLHSIITYAQNHKLDQPFPLHYSNEHKPERLYWPVRYFAPNYMTRSIWSHWGMEYIKLLILLSPDRPEYLDQAKTHLASYKQNIETYGGYPECYNLKGRPLKEGLYRTVLHTSWVINYEQAKMLYNHYSQ